MRLVKKDVLTTYQRETKLFEFSRDKNRKELKMKLNDVTLQWLDFAMTQRYFTTAN